MRTSKIMKKLVILSCSGFKIFASDWKELINSIRSTEKHFYFDIFCLSSFFMPTLKKSLCPDASRFLIPVVKSSSDLDLATVIFGVLISYFLCLIRYFKVLGLGMGLGWDWDWYFKILMGLGWDWDWKFSEFSSL